MPPPFAVLIPGDTRESVEDRPVECVFLLDGLAAMRLDVIEDLVGQRRKRRMQQVGRAWGDLPPHAHIAAFLLTITVFRREQGSKVRPEPEFGLDHPGIPVMGSWHARTPRRLATADWCGSTVQVQDLPVGSIARLCHTSQAPPKVASSVARARRSRQGEQRVRRRMVTGMARSSARTSSLYWQPMSVRT